MNTVCIHCTAVLYNNVCRLCVIHMVGEASLYVDNIIYIQVCTVDDYMIVFINEPRLNDHTRARPSRPEYPWTPINNEIKIHVIVCTRNN